MKHSSTFGFIVIAAAGALFSPHASAAVVASASMTVSATVLPSCAGACTAGAGAAGTEHVVAVASDTAVNPPPASPLVQRMRVISY